MALGREPAQSEFGIICLTAENVQSPWILFEAGAMARSLEARVVPLLFGITAADLDGPLSQFQSVQGDRLGLEGLVNALYDAGKSGLDVSQRGLVFAQMWPLLDDRLRALSEEAAREARVQSPADLLSEFAKLPEQSSPRTAASEGVLERIANERARLRRELKYLEAEEEELTRQDAPISLVERAIEPTQQRLEAMDLTIGTVLDRLFARLTPSQIALLRSLVAPGGTARVLSKQDQAAHRGDLEALARVGLVHVGPHGAQIVHALITEYVAQRLGTA